MHGRPAEQALEDLEVLLGVAHRSVEPVPEGPFDHRLVRRADTEGEPPTRCDADRHGRTGEVGGVARVGADDCGAELDPVGARAGEGERDERVVTRDPGEPVPGEPVGLGVDRPLHEVVERGRSGDVAGEDADAHGGGGRVGAQPFSIFMNMPLSK